MSYTDGNDLHEVAGALNGVASAINKLGLADASTPMGAVELLSKEVREGAVGVADQLEAVASAADFAGVADAIKTIDIQQLADAISDGNNREASLSVAVTRAGKEIASGLKDLAAAIREMRVSA
jgi:hypothetical protein